MTSSDRWDLVWATDPNPDAVAAALRAAPGLVTGDDAVAAMDRGNVDAVLLATSANARPGLIEAALSRGLHVLAEKPLAATVDDEIALLAEIESSDRVVGVNLFNRSTPYHRALVQLVRAGDIGEILAVGIAHLTPDLLPTEGHLAEGPPFHDCGMHYVDLASWYAGSAITGWHAQGLRVWGWPDPWWVDVHGTFANGAIFHIAQTFAYGQGAARITARNEVEVTGTRGVVRLQHDFRTVTVALSTRREATRWQWPYGGKKLDVLLDDFADAIEGERSQLPTPRDAVEASRLAQDMVDAATVNAPVVGDETDLRDALTHKAALRHRGEAFPEGVLAPAGNHHPPAVEAETESSSSSVRSVPPTNG